MSATSRERLLWRLRQPTSSTPRAPPPTRADAIFGKRRFAELTQKKLRRGAPRSVQAFERDIRDWLADWNKDPRPFAWTKTADEIIDKVAAYCRRIADSGH
ncbi:hypothetical protein [Streptomyces rapamycinicus]|uniref:Transposase n=1 Tax=Streptomyces rapamycinicus TaxID=1226757 RepID=A0ABR6LX29_9ACTN|nr:hypothetical protein [Streptomyces rapamycinicus]MBB4786897.1 hypothetical protein [Streptomyces rapamycinicus]UTO66918.1 hypothetical protein LJB45_34450 [Streptomyces rapamycinicus]UTP34874.1 hypothetical protein LIV37_39580 [Streptomyces rapamycinicus NRRL 5491]